MITAASGATSTTEWRIPTQSVPGTVKLYPRPIATSADTAIAAALTGFGLTNLLAYEVSAPLR